MLSALRARIADAFRAGRHDRALKLIADGRRAEDVGNFPAACECYRRAILFVPNHVPAHVNLGIVLAASGDPAGATAAYEQALAIDPLDPYANYNLASLLYLRGEHARAERLLMTALQSKPDFAEAHVTLSNVLDVQRRTPEAAGALEAALRLRPDSSGTLFNYGLVLRKLRRGDEAAAALRRSLELQPDNVDALDALSAVRREQGLMQESLDPLRRALKLAPQRFDLGSRELYALNKDETLSGEQIFALHRAYGLQLERAFPVRFSKFAGERDPDRKLRIGYVSGDFRYHPVAQFLLVPLQHRDRVAYEIFCYSTSSDVDPVTERVRALADAWVESWHLTDAQLADRIHGDAIDILVDLSGHTGMFRLATFAQRPAPVQAAWLGYLNTTGLAQVQYRICDARTDPPGVSDPLHTETLVRLPHSQWCYRPYLELQASATPPCEVNGFVTFGSFNHPAKISNAMCLRWAELLRRLPDTRLVIVGISSAEKRAALQAALTSGGIAVGRLTILPNLPLDEYARWYNSVDIALDTLPYGGGTTTFDALWMGVPVVTATGSTPVSRSAASIVSLLGLDEWIAPSPNEYVDVAVERARDLANIASLRGSLRQRLRSSPLMDEERFTRDLEGAYRSMWRRWCAGKDAQ